MSMDDIFGGKKGNGRGKVMWKLSLLAVSVIGGVDVAAGVVVA
jgi:hypothetical protein